MPPIYFYIPKCHQPEEGIGNIPDFRNSQETNNYLNKLHNSFPVNTVCSWIFQTYLRLRANSYPCELVENLPEKGIVITYWQSIPIDFKPPSQLLIIAVVADGLYPHPYAQLRIVQNPNAAIKYSDSIFIPHWPQPGLIPRNPSRGNKIQNVAYMGFHLNLAPELREHAWREQLLKLGLNFMIVEHDKWHDYSDIDAVLAVRGFSQNLYFDRPATKLYQAWHAGVPAVLGCESAYQAERRNELDYIEVSSTNEVLTALQKLMQNPNLYEAMVVNGHSRAKETSVETLTTRWQDFITKIAMPTYETWCSSSYLSHQSLFAKRFFAKKINGLNQKFTRFIVKRGC